MNDLIIKDNIKIEELIYEVRGKQVMLDSDLAILYEVETKRINEAVKNNIEKFPERYSFRISEEEYNFLKSKVSTSKGGSRKGHNVFTEQGVYMLATILKSKAASEMTIAIMDAFVLMRRFISNDLYKNNNILINHENRILLLEESFDKLSTKKDNNHIFYEGQIYDAYSLLIDILSKAKEEIIEEKKIGTKKPAKVTTSKTVDKKSTTKKASTNKSTVKKATSSKSATAKKASTKKTSTGTKTTAKKSTTRKATTKKSSSKKLPILEYYDLPNLYNQTIVKILAQTPTILFVYWDISDEDRQMYLEKYGEDFFNNTIPYLTVTNQTKNYSFEVEINDYANSWYINIPDSDCKYDVVLFRKPRNPEVHHESVYITSSNDLQTPNDHILFDSLGKTVFFKNVKTNEIISKDTSSLSFMNNIGRIYNIYDLYKEIYKNELLEDKLNAHLTSSKMSS